MYIVVKRILTRGTTISKTVRRLLGPLVTSSFIKNKPNELNDKRTPYAIKIRFLNISCSTYFIILIIFLLQ